MKSERASVKERTETVDVASVLGRLERSLHMTLRAEIVHLGGLHIGDNLQAARRICEVTVVQSQVVRFHAREALRVERRGAPHNTVHNVALTQQKLGEVRAILPRDASDESDTA